MSCTPEMHCDALLATIPDAFVSIARRRFLCHNGHTRPHLLCKPVTTIDYIIRATMRVLCILFLRVAGRNWQLRRVHDMFHWIHLCLAATYPRSMGARFAGGMQMQSGVGYGDLLIMFGKCTLK